MNPFILFTIEIYIKESLILTLNLKETIII